MDLSTDELLDRKNTLNQFENYFNDTNDVLKNIVEKIGWTYGETSSNKPLVKCPFNNEHRMLPSKLDDHCELCLLKQNGYDSTHSLYPSYNLSTTSALTMKIDKITQMNILKSAYEESNRTLKIKPEPREVSRSIERYVCDFTPDERRVLYDSAVKNTKPPSHDFVKNDLLGIDVFNKTIENPKTELELLQEQRDLKRRRAAYRGKRVHTDRKSYIEVLREVVEGLTSSLTQNDCKSLPNETSNSIPVTKSNSRLVYKYEGNQNYDGNPYSRWLSIEVEESKLINDYKEKYKLSQNLSKDNIDTKEPKSSRSRSKEIRQSIREEQLQIKSGRSRSKTKFSGIKYTSSKRSRSPLTFEETKSRWPKAQTKSKEVYRRSRNLSSERYFNTSKEHTVQSNSKETFYKRSRSKSMPFENKDEKSKRPRSRSTSSEYNSRKKHKRSKIPTNDYKVSLSNEEDIDLKSKSREQHKKKNKHKKSKKCSKSPKRSHKSKKNS